MNLADELKRFEKEGDLVKNGFEIIKRKDKNGNLITVARRQLNPDKTKFIEYKRLSNTAGIPVKLYERRVTEG